MSTKSNSGGMFSFLLKDRIVALKNFNRWRIPPASIAIHLCIGSVYAWSIFNPALIKALAVSLSPFIAAICSGVSPFLSLALMLAELWIK